MLLRRFRPMRLVATVHDSPAADRCCRLSRHLADLVLPRYDHVIAVSPPVVHHCRMQSVPERRLTMLAPAVDTREFRRSRSTHEAKRLLEVPDGHAVIGVVGPLVHEHRIDRAMRAFAQLRRVRRHTMMHVVGDGPERQALGELARKLKLEDAVRFWGWQSGTQLYYEAMDAVIVPGGIGTEASSVLEAMAMETPVATVSTNGAAAALGDGACGLILGDDDATWADRLAELLDQPMQRHAFALSARKRAEAEYRFDRRVEELHHLYHRLLSLHRSEPPAAEARQAA
jgi:glycosyltransferase involved in cell wall biosynthesis